VATNTKDLPGTVDPNRLYTYSQLAVVSGLSVRKIRREVEEYRRMGYTQTGTERGRMVRGQQYLDWLETRAVEPDAAA
jgi:hypothetical protein